MTSEHPVADRFSPIFSNAVAAPAAAGQPVTSPTAEQKRSIQKRSEPDGDHHLTFVDLDDSAVVRG